MKVLLAVDGSEWSETAVRAVISQIRPQATEVLVVQIVDTRMVSTPPSWSQPTSPLTEARESVARAAEILKSAGLPVSTRVIEGEARSGILDTAAEWRAEMIVLGSHGRTGLRRFALGSVAETVARHAHCSVMIVRAPPVP